MCSVHEEGANIIDVLTSNNWPTHEARRFRIAVLVGLSVQRPGVDTVLQIRQDFMPPTVAIDLSRQVHLHARHAWIPRLQGEIPRPDPPSQSRRAGKGAAAGTGGPGGGCLRVWESPCREGASLRRPLFLYAWSGRVSRGVFPCALAPIDSCASMNAVAAQGGS